MGSEGRGSETDRPGGLTCDFSDGDISDNSGVYQQCTVVMWALAENKVEGRKREVYPQKISQHSLEGE